MTLPNIQRLRAENWRNNPFILSRLGALQSMEDQLSAQEHRPSVPIQVIPPDNRRMGSDGQPALRGYFDPAGGKNGSISIDPQLLANDTPYQATNTYFHEARHAYQHHVAYHPEDHPEVEPSTAALWKRNDEAYLSTSEKAPGTNKSLYEYGDYYGQPMEVDARKVGNEKNDELYNEQFNDQEGYSDFKENQMLEDENDEDVAKEIGENYQEIAQNKVEAKYKALHPELAEEVDDGQTENLGEPDEQTMDKSPPVEEPVSNELEGEEVDREKEPQVDYTTDVVDNHGEGLDAVDDNRGELPNDARNSREEQAQGEAYSSEETDNIVRDTQEEASSGIEETEELSKNSIEEADQVVEDTTSQSTSAPEQSTDGGESETSSEDQYYGYGY